MIFMKTKWLSLFILLALHVKAQDMKQLFYYLKVNTTDVEVNCYINGFPVYDIKESGELTNQIPVNLALIGKGNELQIVATPIGEGASVSGAISPYAGGDIVSTDDDKEGVLDFELAVSEPITKTYTFDNERFDFSGQLVDVPEIDDVQALKAYGKQLLEWIKAKKTKALVEAMMPKIEATAQAFSVDQKIMTDNMKNVLNESIFKLPVQQVKEEDIQPTPYCNNRVWELKTKSGHPLIYAEEEGGSMSMAIYVANIDGKLRVVR